MLDFMFVPIPPRVRRPASLGEVTAIVMGLVHLTPAVAGSLLPDSDWGGCGAFICSLIYPLAKQFLVISSVPGLVLHAGLPKVIKT